MCAGRRRAAGPLGRTPPTPPPPPPPSPADRREISSLRFVGRQTAEKQNRAKLRSLPASGHAG